MGACYVTGLPQMLDFYCSAHRPHPNICMMLILPKVVHLGVVFASVSCTSKGQQAWL